MGVAISLQHIFRWYEGRCYLFRCNDWPTCAKLKIIFIFGSAKNYENATKNGTSDWTRGHPLCFSLSIDKRLKCLLAPWSMFIFKRDDDIWIFQLICIRHFGRKTLHSQQSQNDPIQLVEMLNASTHRIHWSGKMNRPLSITGKAPGELKCAAKCL